MFESVVLRTAPGPLYLPVELRRMAGGPHPLSLRRCPTSARFWQMWVSLASARSPLRLNLHHSDLSARIVAEAAPEQPSSHAEVLAGDANSIRRIAKSGAAQTGHLVTAE